MSERPSFVAEIWFGLTLPLRAFNLIRKHRAILLLSMAPVFVAIGLYFWSVDALTDVLRPIYEAKFPEWAKASTIVSSIILYLLGALLFPSIVNIVAAPINDPLSEKVEKHLDPAIEAAPHVGAMTFEYLQLLITDIVKSMIIGILGFAFFLLSLVPIIQFVAIPILFALISLQYLSFPQTRRGQGFRESLRFVIHYPFPTLAFGFVSSFFFSIPIVSGFYLPVAVVGGTILFGYGQNWTKRHSVTMGPPNKLTV